MAGRNTFYFCDWIDEESGYRYRLRITPPNTAGVSMTGGTPPPFGDTTGTAGYEHIPKLAVETPEVGSISYPSSLCLGLPSTPTLEVTFDLGHLAGSDVITYLTSDSVKSGGISYAVPSSSHTVTNSTTPVIALLTDFGSSSADIGDFEVAFQGAMLRNPTRRTAFSEADDVGRRTITFSHIIRAVWESLVPEDLAQLVLYHYNVSTNFEAKSGRYSRFYDCLWDDGSTSYGVCTSTRGEDDERFYARCFSVRGLFTAIADLTEEVLKQYTRDSTAAFGFSSIDALDQTITSGGTPYDYIKPYQRDFTQSNGAGSAVPEGTGSGGYHGKQLTYFIGAYWKGSATYPVDTTTLGEAYDNNTDPDSPTLIGGYFVGSDPAGIHTFPDFYSYIVDLIGGAGCKCRYRTNGSSIVLYSAPVGGTTVLGSDRSLKPSTIYTEEGEISEGSEAGAIRAFRCSLPDMEGEDQAEVIVQASTGVLGDGEVGINLHFHNAPFLGAEEDFYYQDSNHTLTDNPDFSGDYVSYGYGRYSCRRLYTFMSPAFMASEVPVLVHESVTYAIGWGTPATIGNPQTWAPFTEHYGTSGLDFTQNGINSKRNVSLDHSNLTQYRSRALAHQTTSGIAYAIAYEMINHLTGFNMWKADFDVDRGVGRFDYIGARFRLNSEDGTLTGLPILAPTALDSLSSHPKMAYCVGVSWGEGDRSTITLLGVPS